MLESRGDMTKCLSSNIAHHSERKVAEPFLCIKTKYVLENTSSQSIKEQIHNPACRVIIRIAIDNTYTKYYAFAWNISKMAKDLFVVNANDVTEG